MWDDTQVLTAKRGRGGLSRKPSLGGAATQDFEDFSDSRWKVNTLRQISWGSILCWSIVTPQSS